jgi:acyl-CoA reductase-like NAD-dependent aldehyde dehydrogenase
MHLPILRQGRAYDSVARVTLVHHASGEPVAEVSQANTGMIVRDVHRMDDAVLERFTVTELLAICRRAADRFIGGTLAIGDQPQSFEDYIGQLSATTGMPVTHCRTNAEKIRKVLADMDRIITGLTRGFDLDILDRGYGTSSHEATEARSHGGTKGRRGKCDAHTLSFFRAGRLFGAVLPSNSPGVHGLWIPAIALKTPIVLKPGREEPWTPLRIIESLAAEGIPREAFGFYPTDHAGAGELLRVVDRAMLFGDASTTGPWRTDPRVEIHGPGYSKVLLGDDTADDWERHLDLITSSIVANGGRSCINASAVWTPRHGRAIADALAERLAKVEALPVEDPNATIAAFANPAMAERISAMIDHELRVAGAVDLTHSRRGSSRLVTIGRCAYLLPAIIWCEDREHPLANREFLFPYASVVECPTAQMAAAIGRTLVVSAVTKDQAFVRSLMASRNVDRLNIGPIPTYQLSWDQPHEGNLFEHLYRQRAFQAA